MPYCVRHFNRRCSQRNSHCAGIVIRISIYTKAASSFTLIRHTEKHPICIYKQFDKSDVKETKISARSPRRRERGSERLERCVHSQLRCAVRRKSDSKEARRAGVRVGHEGDVSGECSAKLRDAAEVGEEERLQLASLVVDGDEAVVSLSVERGQALRRLSQGSQKARHDASVKRWRYVRARGRGTAGP